MKTERIALWDNLKLFLILTVVIGHFAETYTSPPFRSLFIFIYSFHMPLFIFVAGLFHKNKNIAKKATAFFALYVISKVIIFLLRTALGHKVTFSLFTEAGLPWFMFVMAVYTVITYLTRNIDRRWLLIVSVITACFAGYDQSIGDFLVLSRIIVYYPFYLAGTAVSREKLEALNEKMSGWKRLLPLAVLTLWGLICLFDLDLVYVLRPLFTGRNPFNEFFYPMGFLWRLLCYAITTVICLACILAVPAKVNDYTYIGQRTLQIYLWHRLALYLLVYFKIDRLFFVTDIGKLGWLFLAVVLTFVLSNRIFSFPTDNIMKFYWKKPSEANKLEPSTEI